MTQTEVIETFTGLSNKTIKDEMSGSLGLAQRELDLLLGALNTLPEGSLEIPNFNSLATRLNISSPTMQALKQKGFVKNGSGRGKWEVTSVGIKKIAKAMEVELSSDTTVVSNQDSVQENKDQESLHEKVYPIDEMTIGQIAERLMVIEQNVAELLAEKGAIQRQLKEKTSKLV